MTALRRHMVIPPEAVEAAAQAAWDSALPTYWQDEGGSWEPAPSWAEAGDTDRLPSLEAMRAGLTAALPHLRVQETPGPQVLHKPFNDDGVLYCGWATGGRIVDGCGELYPCSTLRSHPNALAAAVGCGICNGLPGNSRCLSCKGTGRLSPPTPAPRPVVDREAAIDAVPVEPEQCPCICHSDPFDGKPPA